MRTTKHRIKRILNKISVYILILSLINCLFIGCYSSQPVNKEIFFSEIAAEPMDEFAIITFNDERIEIKWDTFQVIRDTLYADGLKEESIFLKPVDVKIALADIKYVEIDEYDELATGICVIGSAGLILLIVAAIAAANSIDKTPKKCRIEGFNDK